MPPTRRSARLAGQPAAQPAPNLQAGRKRKADEAKLEAPPARKEPKTSHHSFAYMRSNRAIEFVNPDGEQEKVKTSAVFKVGNKQEAKKLTVLLKQKGNKALKQANTNRPVSAVLMTPAGKNVKAVITPKKTVLNKVSSNGPITFFSNCNQQAPRTPAKQFTAAELKRFKQTEVFQAIKASNEKYKLRQVQVNKKLFNDTAAEKKADGNKRHQTQAQVMAQSSRDVKQASANKYAAASEVLAKNVSWEWLHLVAHMVMGRKSQDEKNLVAGTMEANTDMLFVESELKNIAESLKTTFTLSVKAHMIPGTQFASEIEYTIEAKSLKLSFLFNAQNSYKPHIDFQVYVHTYTQMMLDMQGMQTPENSPKKYPAALQIANDETTRAKPKK